MIFMTNYLIEIYIYICCIYSINMRKRIHNNANIVLFIFNNTWKTQF